MSNLILFDESDGEETTPSFGTNKQYAKHYDEFRKKELISHLKNFSESESDSSDDASTDGELVNPDFDKEFFKSLAFLTSKNPEKYNELPTFFENLQSVEDSVKEKQDRQKKSKPLTVADYQRKRLLDTNGEMLSDEDEETPQVESLTYVQEQEKLKADLKKALKDSDDEDTLESETTGGLFQKREKSKDEEAKEQSDYLKWLAGRTKECDGVETKQMEPLKEYWGKKTLPKEEQFLRDYILNKKYLDNAPVPNYDDVVGSLSGDEEEVEKQEEFEHKYDFRFQEPDSEFIKRYPRNVDDSVRVTDTARKDKRLERKERKQHEKEARMKDLRELQNIRKREIEEKLLKLKEVSGKEEFGLNQEDLDGDFDPDEHDKRMAALFDDNYYGVDEGEQKPEYPDIEQEMNIENWDNFDKNQTTSNDTSNAHCEDDDFNMDCDFDPQESKNILQQELIDSTRGRKKRRKRVSRLAEIIKTEKPAYDPEDEKTYAEYLDEYYKLDYEDIIGDTPCRFKYTECVPNDFGLTVEEIFMASNKELNQWASLKKTMQNRPKNVELNDVEKYNRRRNNPMLKKKIFNSIYGEQAEEEKDEEVKTPEQLQSETSIKLEESVGKTLKKKKKKKNLVKVPTPKDSVTPKDIKLEEPPTKLTPQKSVQVNLVANTVANGNKNQPNGNKKNKLNKVRKPGQGPDQKKPVHLNVKKRKLNDSASENPSKKPKFEAKKNFVANPDKKNFVRNPNKKKFDKKSNKKQNGGLSDDRLKAYGINPKKFASSQKYGNNKAEIDKDKPKVKKTQPTKNENTVKSTTSKSFSKKNALKGEKIQKAAEKN